MPSKPYRAIKPMFQRDRWRLVAGDLVQVLSGKDKGLQGRILTVVRDKRSPRVIVENCNMVKKHVKASGDEAGFIVSMEVPIHYSKVALVDPTTGKPVRTQVRYTEAGEKVRVSVGRNASSTIIPKPKRPAKHFDPDTHIVGPKDTEASAVHEVTYNPADPFPFMAQLQLQQQRNYSALAAAAPVLAHAHARAAAAQCWQRRHAGLAASALLQGAQPPLLDRLRKAAGGP